MKKCIAGRIVGGARVTGRKEPENAEQSVGSNGAKFQIRDRVRIVRPGKDDNVVIQGRGT